MINYIPDTDLTDACLEKIESESFLEQFDIIHWPRTTARSAGWRSSVQSRPLSRSIPYTGLERRHAVLVVEVPYRIVPVYRKVGGVRPGDSSRVVTRRIVPTLLSFWCTEWVAGPEWLSGRVECKRCF